MDLVWEAPTDNGGCPITTFYLKRDDGFSGQPLIEVNAENDPAVRNLPTLRSVTATMLQADLGKTFTFQLFAENRETGYASSEPIRFLFSIEPETPSAAPILLSYNSTQAFVQYLFLDNNHGSDIVSHHL